MIKHFLKTLLLLLLTACIGHKQSHVNAPVTTHDEDWYFEAGKRNFFAAYRTPDKDSNALYKDSAIFYFYKVADTTHPKQPLTKNKRMTFVWLSDIYWNDQYQLSYNLYKYVGKNYVQDATLANLLSSRLKEDWRSKEFINLHKTELDSLLGIFHNKHDHWDITKTLENVYANDQRVRQEWANTKTENQRKVLEDSMSFYDAINIKTVTQILNKYGWPGPNQIGNKANKAIFLVIQHSDPQILINFKSIVDSAYSQKNIIPSDYALYIDRYATYTSGKQIYGTQYQYDSITHKEVLYPIEDPGNVNSRRIQMGLSPLKQ